MTLDPIRPLDEARTLPASWYRDAAQWQRERTAIFGRTWQYFARLDQLRDPGAYVAGLIAGWPVFALRDRNGELRAFHNVCRHRAAPILWDGEGHCDVLRCRYHGWVYDHTGALRRTPEFGEAAEFDKAEFSLRKIRVEAWRGLVFVCLDEGAPSLLDDLGPFLDELKDWPVESYRFHAEATHDIACNWKTYVENYAEGYHVRDIHPGLAQEIEAGAYEVILKDRYAVHRAPQRGGANYSGLWLWRYPNLALNVYDTGMNIERIVPLGHDRTRLVYNFFFSEETLRDDAMLARAMAATKAVTEEDVTICEAVQRNLDAGIYDVGRLSPRHENGVWFFQNLVREALAAA